ncbi:hypothetical protein JF66_21605 [Cryobacterium sp. MLB-32]|uniref:hypothetical protein n=1 Tax=Cryobacterium sp. MLB-32 TaxID=1529318 RepID=UPI0004E6548F|nr:hypothetical protein [Cryobacterium sp. MLB-32]KFF58040.1 hypothetical protein JF66_21605 [Cryobacterium sp. MLB-32]
MGNVRRQVLTFLYGAFGLALVIALGSINPIILGLMLLLVLGLGAWIVPKAYAALALLVSMVAPTAVQLSQLQIASYADEAMILIAVLAFVTKRLVGGGALRKLPGGTAFAVFGLLGLTSGLVVGASLDLVVTDAFLLLKAILFAFAVAQVDWVKDDLVRGARIAAWSLALILISALVNLVIPLQWDSLFSASGAIDRRLGLPVPIGIFTHPSFFGQLMALAAIAIATYRSMVARGPISALLLVGSLAGSVLSARRKVMVALVGVALWVGFKKKPAATWLVTVLGVPMLTVIFWPAITAVSQQIYVEYFLNAQGSARTVFYSSAVILATQYFPLGAGFSRFGTFTASTNYSPEYRNLGFEGIWGLQPGGRFLTDTFWPAILGETGWIGLVAFLIGLTLLTRASLRLYRFGSNAIERWSGLVGVLWSIEYAFESIASPVYVSPPAYLLLFMLLGLNSALLAQTSKGGVDRKLSVSATGYPSGMPSQRLGPAHI